MPIAGAAFQRADGRVTVSSDVRFVDNVPAVRLIGLQSLSLTDQFRREAHVDRARPRVAPAWHRSHPPGAFKYAIFVAGVTALCALFPQMETAFPRARTCPRPLLAPGKASVAARQSRAVHAPYDRRVSRTTAARDASDNGAAPAREASARSQRSMRRGAMISLRRRRCGVWAAFATNTPIAGAPNQPAFESSGAASCSTPRAICEEFGVYRPPRLVYRRN